MVAIVGYVRIATQLHSDAAPSLALRSLAIVTLQQPAKARLATDVRHGNDIVRLVLPVADGKLDEFISQTLVRPFRVIMLHGLLEQIVQVLFTEDIEVIRYLGF